MPMQLKAENDEKLLVVHVSGTLVKADYESFVPEFDRLIKHHDKLRVLFDMTDFYDWEASNLWEDIKFDLEHADIDRLATLSKPFTKATIRYFDHAKATEARQWLGESQNKG